MKANTKLSKNTINAIGVWSGVTIKSDNAKTKAVDSMFADGITSSMLKAPPKGEINELFDSVKVSIVMGFTVTMQALLKKDTKSLSDAQKSDKRYWSMQIGSKLKDLRNALSTREALGDNSDGAGTRPASFESRLKRDLTKYIAQIEKLDAAKFSVVDMLKYLKLANVLIK